MPRLGVGAGWPVRFASGRDMMRFLPCGDDALLVELSGIEEAIALARSLAARPVAGVVDAVPGARTVLVQLSPAANRERVRREVAAREGEQADPDEGETVEIAVVYDGEDLAEVAALTGLAPDEVVERHAAGEYEVAFTGFAPGFAYLSGLDPALHVPRRRTPRTRIPAGSVAIAGEFAGVYPSDSPGGWRLLGRALDDMWRLDRDPPALLRPGMRVRFVSVSGHAGQENGHSGAVRGTQEVDDGAAGAALPTTAGPGAARTDTAPALEVVAAAPHALVEDLGRPGRAALGVSPSGAMDRTALRRANAFVGGEPGCAVIETALGGLRLRARGHVTLAVTGAPVPLTIIRSARDSGPDDVSEGADGAGGASANDRGYALGSAASEAALGTDQEDRPSREPGATGDAVVPAAVRERPAPFDAPFALAAGEELVVGAPERGMYSYVAVRGGFDVAPVLGSASRDTLAGLGPAPLESGAVLPVGSRIAGAVEPWAGHPEPLAASGETLWLDVVAGPRDDWFTPGSLDALVDQDWVVSPRSSRAGLRLEGEHPIERAGAGELPSEGTVTGALQVPPDGQPILFAADRPLTGGYPVIGVVARTHLTRASQAPPGARIRFRFV